MNPLANPSVLDHLEHDMKEGPFRADQSHLEIIQHLIFLWRQVKVHHDQKADDRCILDDNLLYLAAGLGPCDYRVGDKFEMLKNCARFIDKRCEAGGWPTYAELEAKIALLSKPFQESFQTFKGDQMPAPGTIVRVVRLKPTIGFMVKERHIVARRCPGVGRFTGWIPGHGGDCWWVQHDDDGIGGKNPEYLIGAYMYDELAPASV